MFIVYKGYNKLYDYYNNGFKYANVTYDYRFFNAYGPKKLFWNQYRYI